MSEAERIYKKYHASWTSEIKRLRAMCNELAVPLADYCRWDHSNSCLVNKARAAIAKHEVMKISQNER